MKTSLLGCLMALALWPALAGAQSLPTITGLGVPSALLHVGQSGRLLCAPVGFRADDSVYGACHTVTSQPCSGRGCQPVNFTTNWIVTWDLEGNPTLGDACDVVRTHLPQAPQVTYYLGHTAADCFPVALNPTGKTVGIPYGPYSWQVSWYYYVATSADQLYELVDSAIVSPP